MGLSNRFLEQVFRFVYPNKRDRLAIVGSRDCTAFADLDNVGRVDSGYMFEIQVVSTVRHNLRPRRYPTNVGDWHVYTYTIGMHGQ